jgi:UDP-N-acetylmuramyl pentapeptide phosphotransferase/UDP-N-acetylglucosamine-1-phosphate transferase
MAVVRIVFYSSRSDAMPWWAIVYTLIFGVLGFGGIHDDFRNHKPIPNLAADLLANCIAILLVVAYWSSSIAEVIGWTILPLYAFAFACEIKGVVDDVRELKVSPDSELTEKENAWIHRVGIWAAISLIMPAYAMGGLVCLRVLE